MFHDKFLDALEFDVGDFFLVCKFLNDFGSLVEKLSRIVVIRGHAQDFLVVLQNAREVAADDSLLLQSLFLAFGLYEFELELGQLLPVAADLLYPITKRDNLFGSDSLVFGGSRLGLHNLAIERWAIEEGILGA